MNRNNNMLRLQIVIGNENYYLRHFADIFSVPTLNVEKKLSGNVKKLYQVDKIERNFEYRFNSHNFHRASE